jgi:phosphate transport system protein
MRELFGDQLAELEKRAASELRQAVLTLDEIAAAVSDPTCERCDAVARDGRRLRDACRGVDAELVIVAARQAPVAGDLRLVLALLQLAQHERLVANQFELISEQLTHLDPAVPDGQATTGKVSSMATLAGALLQRAGIAFVSRDLAIARQLDRQDDEIDELNRDVFRATVDLEGGPERRELAFRHVLIARCLERIADNGVDIAKQAAFLVTAEIGELADASRARPRPARDAGWKQRER